MIIKCFNVTIFGLNNLMKDVYFSFKSFLLMIFIHKCFICYILREFYHVLIISHIHINIALIKDCACCASGQIEERLHENTIPEVRNYEDANPPDYGKYYTRCCN